MNRVAPKGRQAQRNLMISNYSKGRLLAYADSFQELAKCFAGDYIYKDEDRNKSWERKQLWENKQVLCENLYELSNVLTRMASEVFQASFFSEKEYKRIVQTLRWEKITVLDMYYINNSPLTFTVTMNTEHPGGYTSLEVADMLSVLMDRRITVSVTSPYYIDATVRNYVFVEEAKFYILPGFVKAIKENEEVSGDNYSIVESEQGMVSVLLSDGMGSGSRANQDSGIVIDMMEKLIEAGYRPEAAIRLVNNALLALGEGTNMSTLDLCTLNLHTGICEFRKVGGAASFLKSNSYVEQISGYSLPLGAVSIPEENMVRRELIDNDYIVMMTDGVIDALTGEYPDNRLISYLEEIKEKNPAEMAKALLQFALHGSKGRILDDMTIVVLGIFRNR